MIILQVAEAGSLRSNLTIGSTLVTVNSSTRNVDFRVLSDDGSINLYSDAGFNAVGIGGQPSSDTRLHVQGDGTKSATVRIESTDTDAGVGPVCELLRNPGEAVQVNDDLGKIEFQGPGGDGSGTPKAYAQIKTEAQGATSGNEHARVMFTGLVSGTMKEFIRYSASGIEINAFEQDIDTKISSDGVDGLLTVDASQDNIGMGTNTPDSGVERLHIQGTGTSKMVMIESTDASSSSAPDLVLYRNSGTPAVSDDIGQIQFVGNDSGGSGTEQQYAKIGVTIVDETAGTEDGRLIFDVTTASGTSQEYLRMGGQAVVFNEGSGDIDFRIESNGNVDMFKIDGGLNLVSVGAAPTSGGATFQVPDNTISHYANVNTIRSDAVSTMVMVNEDNQGQMWVHDSVSAHTIQLVEGGVKGMHFQFMSTDGNITIDPQGSDTLNGGTASLTRSTNFEIYDVFCYANGKWALSNPA